MQQPSSKTIILKSVRDFSKHKHKLKITKDLEQIKAMFSNNPNLSLSQSRSIKTQNSQSTKLPTSFKKYCDLSNSSIMQRVIQNQVLSLGLLGEKSKSINFKNGNYFKVNEKKKKTNSKIIEDQNVSRQRQLLKLQPLKNKPNIAMFLKKMQKSLERQQEQKQKLNKIRRVATQLNSDCRSLQKMSSYETINFSLNSKNVQKNDFQTILNNAYTDKSVKRLKLDLRRQLFSKNKMEQDKKATKQVPYIFKKAIYKKQYKKQEKSKNQLIGPWMLENEEGLQFEQAQE